jgi:hypothetical protein
MPVLNTFTLNLDVKDSNYISGPVITASDTVRFVVNVTDDGLLFDLTGMTLATIAHTRPDGIVVLKSGTKTGTNQVTFDLGTSEISIHGRINAKVQIYNADNRISTLDFGYTVTKDPSGADFVPSTNEKTLIEEVLFNGPQVIADAQTATTNANNAATNANTKMTAFQTAEDTRVANENTRISNENTRKSNETTRGTNETARQTAETTRGTNETARQTAETTRGTNETTRQTNETARQSAIVELVHKGTWNSATAYKVRNVVTLGNASYMAIANSTNQSPPNATYWNPIVDVNSVVTNANTATTNANNAATAANTAKTNADTATGLATAATTAANTAKTNADTATTNANNAATAANTAKTNADTATGLATAATTAANTAKTNADTATTNANNAATAANTAKTNADTATGLATAATTAANTAKDNAVTATTNANNATTAANTAKTNADTATTNANNAATAANTAKTNADTATSQANTARDAANTAATGANTAATNANNVANATSHKGAYSAATAYVPNNIVYYNGGSYMNVVASTGIAPSDTSKWKQIADKGDQGIQGIQGVKGDGFIWKGTYSSATSYSVRDIVIYNGNSYVNKVASLNKLPTDTGYWDIFAQKGVDGTGAVISIASANGDAVIGGTIQTPDIAINTTLKTLWGDKYTKAEVDTLINQATSNIQWKPAVANFAAIATTYTSPQDGWTVNVNDTDYTYRYTGSAWVAISANSIPNASGSSDGKMSIADYNKLAGISAQANKTTSSGTNGSIKIDNVDTVVYTHPTGAGNNHVPTGGATGNYLKWSASGVATWVTPSASDLSDMSLVSLANNQVLKYDSTSGKWKNAVVNWSDVANKPSGSGSGLDADLLDGQHGSYYAQRDSATLTGLTTLQGSAVINGTETTPLSVRRNSSATEKVDWSISDALSLWAYTNDEFSSTMRFTITNTDTENSDGSRANTGTIDFKQSNTETNIYVNNNVVWNAGNDGPGSGLNADMVDGFQMDQDVRINSSPTFVQANLTSRLKISSVSPIIEFVETDQVGVDEQRWWIVADGKGLSFRTATDAGANGNTALTFTRGTGLTVTSINSNVLVAAPRFQSTQATGTSPFVVASTTVVTNLNADLLDGQHGSYYAPVASPTFTGTVNLPSARLATKLYFDSYTPIQFALFDVANGNIAWIHGSGGAGDNILKLTRKASSDYDLFVNGSGMIWHSGNDGAGSGLDADKLGGMYPYSNGTPSAIVARDANGDIVARRATFSMAAGTAPFSVTSNTVVSNLNVQYLAGYEPSTGASNNTVAVRDSSGILNSSRFISTIATGTAPFGVTSTTVVSNLNADMVDGYQASTTSAANSIAVQDANQDITVRRVISNATTGTAPFGVTSTTVVTNLNADMLDGKHSSDFASIDYVDQSVNSIISSKSSFKNNLLIARSSNVSLSTGSYQRLGSVESTFPYSDSFTNGTIDDVNGFFYPQEGVQIITASHDASDINNAVSVQIKLFKNDVLIAFATYGTPIMIMDYALNGDVYRFEGAPNTTRSNYGFNFSFLRLT